MLRAVSAETHVARPFTGVLTSNVPGDYPPDQWADITVAQLINILDGASEERKRKVHAFRTQVREILILAFQTCQAQEQYMLGEHGVDHYSADPGIDQLVIDASGAIIDVAREHLVFGPLNLGDLFFAPRRMAVANTIGTNLATSVSITRRWHAHAREDDPRAKAFLGE